MSFHSATETFHVGCPPCTMNHFQYHTKYYPIDFSINKQFFIATIFISTIFISTIFIYLMSQFLQTLFGCVM